MKKIKKISGIIIIVALVALIIIKLLVNKQQLDQELQASLSYSYAIPVEVVSAKFETPVLTIVENGFIKAFKEIDLISETQGKVTFVAGGIGDRVKAGQVLVVVEKEVLESQVKLAKANLDNATKDLERFQKLAAGEAVTAQQLENAQLNQQNALTNYTVLKDQLANSSIKAPITGFVRSRSIEKGSFISPGIPVMSISEQADLSFIVRVSEGDVNRIKSGQAVQVAIDVTSGNKYAGTVKEIGVAPDLSGRYEVNIHLSNPEFQLRFGMTGTATFSFPAQDQKIILPRRCITGSIKKAAVFVVQGDSVIEKAIVASPVGETEVAVEAGLVPGEKVVLTGQINLEAGTKVNVINK